MRRSVLMIAYHFPPLAGSSGVLRTLKFCEHLPALGWRPLVLAPTLPAYPMLGPPVEFPAGVEIHRAFALDVARHLAIRGAYFSWMAIPDRWNTWIPTAVAIGLRILRKYRPAVIWSTYPVPSAHVIACTLSRLSGIPWIADFRDPMVYGSWPANPAQRRAYSWIEGLAVKHCQTAVFVTPSASRLYAERYPRLNASRNTVIANGFDAEDLKSLRPPDRAASGQLILVHSGLMEIPDRDPTGFFDALAELKRCNQISSERLKVVLRASGQEPVFRKLLIERGIDDLVSLQPRIPYREALLEMLSADGLLLFQGRECNLQIPAKAYEYLAARRPIFALADRGGDTWGLLHGAGIRDIASLDSASEIVPALRRFLASVHSGSAQLPEEAQIATYSRAARAKEFANLLVRVGEGP